MNAARRKNRLMFRAASPGEIHEATVPICVRPCCLCRIGLPPFVVKVEGGRGAIPPKEET